MTFPSLEGIPLTETKFAAAWAWYAFHRDKQVKKLPFNAPTGGSDGKYAAKVRAHLKAGYTEAETARMVGCSRTCVNQVKSRAAAKEREWANLDKP